MSADGADRPKREDVTRAKVLVVDDHRYVRIVVAEQLRGFGFTAVEMAEDGEQAIRMIEAMRPDLVILDIMMPKMDGFAVCQWVRARPEFADLPVIVQTALDSVEDRTKAFNLGASDFLLKPSEPAELRARVMVHLHNRQLTAALSRFHVRITEELETAQHIQRSLLPDAAAIAAIEAACGLKLTATFQPSTEMAGDFWTAWPLPGGRLGVLIADLSGHGVGAAMNVSRLHAIMTPPPAEGADPAALLALLNRRMKELLPIGQFAAGFAMVIDPAQDRVQYCGSAFPSVVLVEARGAAPRLLDGGGLPLGIGGEGDFVAAEARFAAGGVLLCYSDALVETDTLDGPRLADTAVAAMVMEAGAEDPVAFVNARFAALTGDNRTDDLTMVCLRRP